MANRLTHEQLRERYNALVGTRFGIFEILSFEKTKKGRNGGNYKAFYLTVKCLCGDVITVAAGMITNKNLRSCGCIQYKFGHSYDLFVARINNQYIYNKWLCYSQKTPINEEWVNNKNIFFDYMKEITSDIDKKILEKNFYIRVKDKNKGFDYNNLVMYYKENNTTTYLKLKKELKYSDLEIKNVMKTNYSKEDLQKVIHHLKMEYPSHDMRRIRNILEYRFKISVEEYNEIMSS